MNNGSGHVNELLITIVIRTWINARKMCVVDELPSENWRLGLQLSYTNNEFHCRHTPNFLQRFQKNYFSKHLQFNASKIYRLMLI